MQNRHQPLFLIAVDAVMSAGRPGRIASRASAAQSRPLVIRTPRAAARSAMSTSVGRTRSSSASMHLAACRARSRSGFAPRLHRLLVSLLVVGLIVFVLGYQ